MGACSETNIEIDSLSAKRMLSEPWRDSHAANIEFGNALPRFKDASSDQMSVSVLTRAIEFEIIPRLMLAHRSPGPCRDLSGAADVTDAGVHVEAFAKLVLQSEDGAARAYIEVARQCGVSLATVYVNLLGPAARYLGELWEKDLCDFTEVTVGLGRLQKLLHEFSPVYGATISTISSGRRILLLPSPGDQHSFGLIMVGELFRCAGWDVAGGPAEHGADVEMLAHHAWYDIVGFSVGCDANVASVAEAIRVVRRASMNQRVGIMVGGPTIAQHPECAPRFEADICTNDGRQAPILAERFVSNLEAQSG